MAQNNKPDQEEQINSISYNKKWVSHEGDRKGPKLKKLEGIGRYVIVAALGIGLLPFPLYRLFQEPWWDSEVSSYASFWYSSLFTLILIITGLNQLMKLHSFWLYFGIFPLSFASVWVSDWFSDATSLSWKAELLCALFPFLLIGFLGLQRHMKPKGK